VTLIRPAVAGCNLRQLGGSRLYRSDAPTALTDEARRRFDALGLTTVVDLRTPGERAEMPNDFADAPGIDYHAVNLNAGLGGLNDSAWDGTGLRGLGELYVAFLDKSTAELASVLKILADASGPALFHCAIGKDRTGVVAMLVRGLRGEDEQTIVDDYLATKTGLAPLMPYLVAATEAWPNGSSWLFQLEVKAEFLQAALEYVRGAGGFEAYAIRRLGLTAAEMEALRRRR